MSQRQDCTDKKSDKSSHHSSKDRLRNTSPSSTRITIKQNVPTTSKNGPQNTKRSVDPNDISITRRFGEGSKPLFAREDVRVNRSPSKQTDSKRRSESESSSQSSDSDVSTFRKRIQSDSKKRSRSDDRSSKRNDFKQSSSSKERHPAGHSSGRGKSYSPKRKLPYFVDAKREQDRIRQKYGESSSRSRRDRSSSRSRHRSRYRSHSRDRRRSPSRDRRRSPSRDRRRSSRRSRSPSRYRNDRLAPIPVQPPFLPVHFIEYITPPPPWGAHYPRMPLMIRPPPFPMMPPYYGYIPRPPPQWHGRFSRPNRPNRPRNH